MDLKIFHDTVQFFVNKEQGGWLSPDEIDNITDRAQMAEFTRCLPLYGKTQKDTDPLAPFVVKQSFTTLSNGIVTLPSTYLSLPVVTVTYTDSGGTRYKPVKILSEDETAERLDSQILKPTASDPVGTETTPGVIQLYPATALSGYVTYLRRPLRTVFAYTQTGRTITYNQAGSTQLEWAEASINKILVKTINMFGCNLNDELVLQYTELKNSQDI